MNKLKPLVLVPVLLGISACQSGEAGGVVVDPGARGKITLASFNEDGSLNQPENWREWVYVGTPFTPDELNNGAANFPEFHNVYIDPASYRHYETTGDFPEGTQIVKELVLVRGHEGEEGGGQDADNGSTQEVSGRGYFMGEFAGLEMSIKDSTRFPNEPGNWAYFSWGHQPQPYAATATAFATASCNACHDASAEDDFVFTQFYPVFRAAKGSKSGN